MIKDSKILLSNRQIEILKLRKQGLSQKQISERIKTTRENVNILEKRAYRNIKRATATLHILNHLEISALIKIQPHTHILDVPRMVLDAADKSKIKIRANCFDILDELRIKMGNKIKSKYLIEPLTITILPDGSHTIE
jgi:Tfx family DNA-binding protein